MKLNFLKFIWMILNVFIYSKQYVCCVIFNRIDKRKSDFSASSSAESHMQCIEAQTPEHIDFKSLSWILGGLVVYAQKKEKNFDYKGDIITGWEQ